MGRVTSTLQTPEGYVPIRLRGAANTWLFQEQLASALKDAKPYSIDAWLEHNPKYLEIGKRAIAATLLEYEKDIDLRPEAKGDWYQLLFHRLNCPFDEFVNNKLSIITFNYDRSLENFLFNSFTNTHTERFEKDEEECIKKLNQLKILHVYGSLGRLRWQTKGPENPTEKVDFGASLVEATIMFAANSIQIISESGTDVSPKFQQARELIESAKALYFLGFGYHNLNIDRL